VYVCSFSSVNNFLTWRWPTTAETCRHQTNKLRHSNSCALTDLPTNRWKKKVDCPQCRVINFLKCLAYNDLSSSFVDHDVTNSPYNKFHNVSLPCIFIKSFINKCSKKHVYKTSFTNFLQNQNTFHHVSVVATTVIREVHLHEPKHRHCTVCPSCTHRLTSRPHQHRTCSTQRCSTPEAVEQSGKQNVGFGTCTVVGIYRCVCVCACVHACL
jgi:hypothetical protein